ncbi:unnamed protein product, partial [Allacma fusca]
MVPFRSVLLKQNRACFEPAVQLVPIFSTRIT